MISFPKINYAPQLLGAIGGGRFISRADAGERFGDVAQGFLHHSKNLGLDGFKT
jgi:hypothetical protein